MWFLLSLALTLRLFLEHGEALISGNRKLVLADLKPILLQIHLHKMIIEQMDYPNVQPRLPHFPSTTVPPIFQKQIRRTKLNFVRTRTPKIDTVNISQLSVPVHDK